VIGSSLLGPDPGLRVGWTVDSSPELTEAVFCNLVVRGLTRAVRRGFTERTPAISTGSARLFSAGATSEAPI